MSKCDPLEEAFRIGNADRGTAGNAPSVVNISASPIEQAMLFALLECGCGLSTDPARERLATVYQQHPIPLGQWTAHADIALVRAVGRREVRIAIELDGHEFHQRTKEQVERDYSRDRALARAGWIVVRFSGSEVWRDAGACALEVAGILIDAISRIQEGR